MTSLAHFEKIAGIMELPHQAVIDGRLENVTPRNGTAIHRVAKCDAADGGSR